MSLVGHHKVAACRCTLFSRLTSAAASFQIGSIVNLDNVAQMRALGALLSVLTPSGTAGLSWLPVEVSIESLKQHQT